MNKNIVYSILILGICLLISADGLRESSRPKHDKTVVCYIASWASYRPGRGNFDIGNISPEFCTHLIYSFAGLNASESTIRPLDPWGDLEDDGGKGGYKKITSLKEQYQGLKVMLAIGGWNEKSANYSALAASPRRRSIFAESVLGYLRKYNFDGLDLDWEFPGKRGGAPYDKENFVNLIRVLSQQLKPRGLLLTAAISADKSTIDGGYDMPQIAQYLDFIHVMAYDYHGAWNKRVLPNAPMKCSDDLCIESTMNYLIDHLKTPAEKLVLGLPAYGRTFNLLNKWNNSSSPMGLEAWDRGFQGDFTREDGFMGYNEICRELIQSGLDWTTGFDTEANTAWMVHGDKVIVYDDPRVFYAKAEYATWRKLGGVMVWSMDTDDFHGDCAKINSAFLDTATEYDFPLMRAIDKAFTTIKPSIDNNHNNKKIDKGGASTRSTEFFIIISSLFISFKLI